MFAKLFARITESSLMEEDIPVRYAFVMLLAISDPEGLVIGTDVAIARRLNMPLEEFAKCIQRLSSPDEGSNSKEEAGKRVVVNEGERGYRVVNYLKYRNCKSQEERREYMREYMRQRRQAPQSVNSVNSCKTKLTDLTQAEAEAEAEAFKVQIRGTGIPANEGEAVAWASMENVPAEFAIQIFNEREGTQWTDGAGRPITNWRSHIKGRFSKQQTFKPETKAINGRPLSVMDIKSVMLAKQAELEKLRYDETAKEKRVAIREELKNLNVKLAGMA